MGGKEKDFLRILKHQLKAPLTLIKGYLSFWETQAFTKFPPEKQKEFILKALESAKKLDNLINDAFLTLILEENKPDVFIESFDIKTLIESIYQETINPAYNAKSLDFSVIAKTNRALITTDINHLRVILQKLLDNAFKNTSRGAIRVNLEQKKPYTIIEIEDTGTGFSKQDRQKAFTKLFHGSLSLYLVKKLAVLLKGKISLESKQNKGSTITIKLPNLK